MRVAAGRIGRIVFFLIVNRGCLIIVQSSMEQEENEKLFEDFPVVHNSAVYVCKLFEKKKTLTLFWKEEENEGLNACSILLIFSYALYFGSNNCR